MSGVWRGVRDRRRWAGRGRRAKLPARRVNEYGDKLGGSAKRKRRGRRSEVARCCVVVGEHFETPAGEVVVSPSPRDAGMVVRTLCGRQLKGRHGWLRCPEHGRIR